MDSKKRKVACVVSALLIVMVVAFLAIFVFPNARDDAKSSNSSDSAVVVDKDAAPSSKTEKSKSATPSVNELKEEPAPAESTEVVPITGGGKDDGSADNVVDAGNLSKDPADNNSKDNQGTNENTGGSESKPSEEGNWTGYY